MLLQQFDETTECLIFSVAIASTEDATSDPALVLSDSYDEIGQYTTSIITDVASSAVAVDSTTSTHTSSYTSKDD